MNYQITIRDIKRIASRLSDTEVFVNPWAHKDSFIVSVTQYEEGHVQTTKHWRAGRAFTPNKLKMP